MIPKDNEKDLADVPDVIKERLEIIPVGSVDEVLEHSLTKPLVPIEWDEESQSQVVPTAGEDDGRSGVVTH